MLFQKNCSISTAYCWLFTVLTPWFLGKGALVIQSSIRREVSKIWPMTVLVGMRVQTPHWQCDIVTLVGNIHTGYYQRCCLDTLERIFWPLRVSAILGVTANIYVYCHPTLCFGRACWRSEYVLKLYAVCLPL
jgi:hypothetical protein